jgi:hypothetical protein
MAIEVNAFFDSSLDVGLFAVPAGYSKVASDPNHIFGKPAKHDPAKEKEPNACSRRPALFPASFQRVTSEDLLPWRLLSLHD